MQRILTAVVAAVLVLATTAAGVMSFSGPYRVTVVLDNAANLIEGSLIKVNGFDAGQIEDLEVVDGRAQLSLVLNREFAPLHDGATVSVVWKALLGERLVNLTDGPAGNAEIPSGGMLTGDQPAPVELDTVLAALDPPTREKLNSLTRNLDETLAGSEGDLNATLKTAGPAIGALGDVLRGLGTDGEAVRQLVTRLNETMAILARRDGDVSRVVDQLGGAVDQIVAQREALGGTLRELPPTLRQARTTLDSVPGTVEEVTPLLEALEPARGCRASPPTCARCSATSARPSPTCGPPSTPRRSCCSSPPGCSTAVPRRFRGWRRPSPGSRRRWPSCGRTRPSWRAS